MLKANDLLEPSYDNIDIWNKDLFYGISSVTTTLLVWK